jgi:hypothetical protein
MTEDIEKFLRKMREHPLFADHWMQFSLFEQLVDTKLAGKSDQFTAQTVMTCYGISVREQHDKDNPNAWEAGVRMGRELARYRRHERPRGGTISIPSGMDKWAYRAGVRWGKAEKKKWENHPAKSLFADLCKTLVKYEAHLRSLPVQQQPPLFFRMQGYEPILVPLSPSAMVPEAAGWRKPIERATNPQFTQEQHQDLAAIPSAEELADTLNAATDARALQACLEALVLRIGDYPQITDWPVVEYIGRLGLLPCLSSLHWSVRSTAFKLLGVIIEKRPDVFRNPPLRRHEMKIEGDDAVGQTRNIIEWHFDRKAGGPLVWTLKALTRAPRDVGPAAFETARLIVQNWPQLADVELVTAVSDTIVSMEFRQCAAVEDLLSMCRAKRPDLFGGRAIERVVGTPGEHPDPPQISGKGPHFIDDSRSKRIVTISENERTPAGQQLVPTGFRAVLRKLSELPGSVASMLADFFRKWSFHSPKTSAETR